jgi:hypothetical protein
MFLFINNQRMTAIELIDETVAYYSQDTSRRAVDKNGFCEYKIGDKMCAVGRCVLKKKNTRLAGGVNNICKAGHKINLESILKAKYKGLPQLLWIEIQSIHDVCSYWDNNGLTTEGQKRVNELKDKWKDQ